MNKSIIIFLLTVLAGTPASSQDRSYRYWVTLRDKDSSFSVSNPSAFLSAKSIARRQKYGIPISGVDLPVSNAYVTAVRSLGLRVKHKSKWMNALTVYTRRKELADSLRRLPFVGSVQFLGELKTGDDENEPKPVDINEALSVLESKFNTERKADSSFYGKSQLQLSMLNLPALHAKGLTGQGVSVAIIDAGFKNADKLKVFKYAFDSGHVAGTKDFVAAASRPSSVFDDDDHGIAVWSCMGAYQPHVLVGSSPGASYWLLRSEYTNTESLLEEAHWVAAAEYADSVGVDMINSSLGYNTFDDKNLNHAYKDLNGTNTIISRAAGIAASRGILVVNSTGNEGDNPWKYIVAPADAFNILTVGGVDAKLAHVSFSSVGPTVDKRIKPDVVALGESVWVASEQGTVFQGNGTSYACPIVAGVAACLMQANPLKTNSDLIKAMQLSSTQYNAPDAYVGYGVPDAVLANKLLGGDTDFPLVKDGVLDARILPDGKIHVAVFSRTPQKIKVTVEDASKIKGGVILKDVADFKNPGVKRVSIGKVVKVGKGPLAVYLHSRDGVSSYLIERK